MGGGRAAGLMRRLEPACPAPASLIWPFAGSHFFVPKRTSARLLRKSSAVFTKQWSAHPRLDLEISGCKHCATRLGHFRLFCDLDAHVICGCVPCADIALPWRNELQVWSCCTIPRKIRVWLSSSYAREGTLLTVQQRGSGSSTTTPATPDDAECTSTNRTADSADWNFFFRLFVVCLWQALHPDFAVRAAPDGARDKNEPRMRRKIELATIDRVGKWKSGGNKRRGSVPKRRRSPQAAMDLGSS